MKRWYVEFRIPFAALVLMVTVAACGRGARIGATTQPQSETAPTKVEVVPALYNDAAERSTDDGARGLEGTLTSLYRETNASVVYIVVSSSGGGRGSGSGFVYDNDGHIVTNFHVASGATSYEIVFAGGERIRARLIGADADSDLAVLKVEDLPKGAEPLPLADYGSVEVGQLAVAIGSPFGAEGSMSLGIVSGLGRSLRSQRAPSSGSTYSLPEVIQTDAPINPGNSGGPLLNLDGEVIGVNAAMATASGTNSGVGFSIPVAAVKLVVPSLIADGEYVYPYLGASFAEEISLAAKRDYGLSQTNGTYVIGMTPTGPADRAGVVPADARTGRGGDLIVDINGQSIRDFSDLNSYLVFRASVGQVIEVTVLRDGELIVLPLKLGARP